MEGQREREREEEGGTSIEPLTDTTVLKSAFSFSSRGKKKIDQKKKIAGNVHCDKTSLAPPLKRRRDFGDNRLSDVLSITGGGGGDETTSSSQNKGPLVLSPG